MKQKSWEPPAIFGHVGQKATLEKTFEGKVIRIVVLTVRDYWTSFYLLCNYLSEQVLDALQWSEFFLINLGQATVIVKNISLYLGKTWLKRSATEIYDIEWRSSNCRSLHQQCTTGKNSLVWMLILCKMVNVILAKRCERNEGYEKTELE